MSPCFTLIGEAKIMMHTLVSSYFSFFNKSFQTTSLIELIFSEKILHKPIKIHNIYFQILNSLQNIIGKKKKENTNNRFEALEVRNYIQNFRLAAERCYIKKANKDS